ncbi:MAG: glutaredoxin 3 [Polyangiales bacterium]
MAPQKPIVVYSTEYCPYCVRVKMLLKSRGYAFEEIDVSGNAEKRAWLVKESGGRRTVPVVFIDGKHVGGYDETAALDRTGELARLVRG